VTSYKSLGSFVTGEPPEVSSDSYGFIHETFAGLSLDQPIHYPSLPFSPDLCTILSRLPSGFSELCLSARLSIQTMQILASLDGTNTSFASDTSDSSRLDAELQAMLSALQRLSLMRISGLEKYLTCGLVAFAFQLRYLRPLNLFHDPPLRTFIRIIPAQEKPDSSREQNCMIWTTMSVAGALALRTIRMPGTHLILDRLFRLYPATTDWDYLEPILTTFFTTPNIIEHWKKCHATGLARWKHVTRVSSQSPPSLIDLEKVSEKISEPSAIEGGDVEDAIKELSKEQLRVHLRESPKDMMDMMRAARCPFQARMKNMGIDSDGMANPHGDKFGK
jgi:hypothetical protein